MNTPDVILSVMMGSILANFAIGIISLFMRDVSEIRQGNKPLPISMYVFQGIRNSIWLGLLMLTRGLTVDTSIWGIYWYATGVLLLTFLGSMLAEVLIRFLIAWTAHKLTIQKLEKEVRNYKKDDEVE